MSDYDEYSSFSDDNPDMHDLSSPNISTNTTKPWEISYFVFTPDQIHHSIYSECQPIMGMFELSYPLVKSLLQCYRWNVDKLVEDYTDKPDAVLDTLGLLNYDFQPVIKSKRKFQCPICYSDVPGQKAVKLGCKQEICTICLHYYLGMKIDEHNIRLLKCPGNCGFLLSENTIRLISDEDIMTRYAQLEIEDYIQDRKSLKPCPLPNCTYTISCTIPLLTENNDHVIPSVKCPNEHQWCFQCMEEAHQPCPCKIVKVWLKKCSDDSETSNWISANTKECTKCQSIIEKNGGCNHIVCKKCQNEFCWVCLGSWSLHGQQWYNCNRFEEPNAVEARDRMKKSRFSLERYLHVITPQPFILFVVL